MPELILHQYPFSPFSEKIRRILAFKGLGYRAVRAPAVMPKPDVVALTGGYRKIPVLQIANHVYCDTSLIARVVEQRRPQPTLYPGPLAEVVAEWADSALFEAVVAVAMRPTRLDELVQTLSPEELTGIRDDRKAMRADARRSAPPPAAARSHLVVYLDRLESALAGQAFLNGESPSIADFSAYHCVWFLTKMSPEPLDGRAAIQAWAARVAAISGPEGVPMTSEEALGVCRDSPAEFSPAEPFSDSGDLTAGRRVRVRALDYGRDPVEGELAHASRTELVVRRQDERAGTVYVHFPRAGYETEAL